MGAGRMAPPLSARKPLRTAFADGGQGTPNALLSRGDRNDGNDGNDAIVIRWGAVFLVVCAPWPGRARAADVPAEPSDVAHAADGAGADDAGAMPYATPRQTLIPGTPGMAGGFHLMVNGFAHAQT